VRNKIKIFFNGRIIEFFFFFFFFNERAFELFEDFFGSKIIAAVWGLGFFSCQQKIMCAIVYEVS